MKIYLQNAVDFILPPRCPVCRDRVINDGDFCARCWSGFSFIIDPLCKVCGLPFDYEIEEGLVCGSCVQRPPVFDRARSVFLYETKGRSLILALKNNRSFVGFTALAKLMNNVMVQDNAVDLIIPVPLHPFRLIRRRFNQSQLLANAYALSCGGDVLVNTRALKRSKNTVSQGTLNRRKRHQNVKNAFVVQQRYQSDVRDKNILLIDDVYTTGATLNACAATLKKAGAREVIAITLARVAKGNVY